MERGINTEECANFAVTRQAGDEHTHQLKECSGLVLLGTTKT